MPKRPIFEPQENDTFAQHLERLKQARPDEYTDDSKAAALMTTVMMMGHGNGATQIPAKPFKTMQDTLKKSPSFKALIKSPEFEEMVGRNDTEGLFKKFHELETKRQEELDRKYKRPVEKEVVAKDAELLKNAIEGLKNNAGKAPTTGSSEIVRRGVLYKEMMKQLEYAQTMAEKGIQLSGEQTKNLITAVKKYNNGGSRNVKPGGEKQAEGFVESMAVLKNYMPAAEFNRYCAQINMSRGVQSRSNLDYVSPHTFEPERLTGAVPAKELAAQNRERLRRAFGTEAAAEAVAIQQLSHGDPNRLLRPEEVERQAGKINQKGTAFMRAMQDPETRQRLQGLADRGEAMEVATTLNREVTEEARKRVVRTAQGEINRSIRHLTGGTPNNRFFTEQYLANILASEQLALNAEGDETITNEAFRNRAEEVQKDPAFQRLADRYLNDPEFRTNMNNGLQQDRSGKTLSDALQAEKQPVRRRAQEAEQVQPNQPEQQVI